MCRSKFAVKESQSLARIPDTLVYAMEFIMLPTPGEQSAALDTLRKEVLRNHPELKVGALTDSTVRPHQLQRGCFAVGLDT